MNKETETETAARKLVQGFKFTLLRKMPFYGDILMRLPVEANPHIPTARTDGGRIEYNPSFICGLQKAEANFVIMHEVFHVLLFHCRRIVNRDPGLWNAAADIIVNDYLSRLSSDMRKLKIEFKMPAGSIYRHIMGTATVEYVYAQLVKENEGREADGYLLTKDDIFSFMKPMKYPIPDDIVFQQPEDETPGAEAAGASGARLSEKAIIAIIRESAVKNRSSIGSCFVPDRVLMLTQEKSLPWQTLLRSLMNDAIDEEASWQTPERKYLHMDMILPGNGITQDALEEVWAFVDSSGSVSEEELSRFLTQLWHLVKDFGCTVNLCYWHTKVDDVYLNIRSEKELLKAKPAHSGGTDINCVYRWLTEQKVKPGVMLILTDGYFGTVKEKSVPRSLKNKTVVVLSTNTKITENMRTIGRYTRLDLGKAG